MFASAATRTLQIGRAEVEATTETRGGETVVTFARVPLATPVRRPGGDVSAVGLVMADSLDGSTWSVSLGNGWLPNVTFSGIHEAVAALTNRRTLAALRRLERAQRAASEAREVLREAGATF